MSSNSPDAGGGEDIPRKPFDPSQPAEVLLPMPQNVRSVALGVLMVLAVLAVLKLASGFFIPLMIGLVFSYALSPVVDGCQRWRIPRSLTAAILVLGILGGTGAAVYSLSDDANELISTLPDAARKVRDSLRRSPKTSSKTLDSVQQAAAELQRAAEDAAATGATVAPRGHTPRGTRPRAGFRRSHRRPNRARRARRLKPG